MAELLHRAIYLLGLDKQKCRIFVELFFLRPPLRAKAGLK